MNIITFRRGFYSNRRCVLIMSLNRRKTLWFLSLFSLLFAFGCKAPDSGKQAVAEQGDVDVTIGNLAEVFASDAIFVRGYALVGGLNGTGSAECPAQIRSYIEKYILQHLSGSKVNVAELIADMDTAVVVVEGIIPAASSKSQRFDVRIAALPGTQTTSLEGGSLYGADLYEARQLGMSIKPLATAEGPVYVDLLDADSADPRAGYVFGGGSVFEEYKIDLALRRPDYRMVSQIRNRINEHFGYQTALALAPGSVELQIPAKYEAGKDRFLQLVRLTYIIETPELTEKRILTHVRNLAASGDKNESELALEAIGNACLPRLASLLNSSDPEVRFRAARCMSNLGDKQGRAVLWEIANDKNSSYRVDAVNAAANAEYGRETVNMLRVLLRDPDFPVRIAAYENLVRLNDTAVSKTLIAKSFFLDQITGGGKSAVFVSRQNQPRVALFGAPIYCKSDLFIETTDGTITINSQAGEKSAAIIRRHPKRPDIIISLKSSLDLADIIQTLCSEPVAETGHGGPGLGISYSALVGLLSHMAEAGAFDAEFHAGPTPKNLPIIKK